MNPRVRDVVPKDDYKLEITFSSGEVGIFDCAHLIDFGVFSELKDVGYFRRARAEHGTVVWPNEQDICPDTLYVDSTKVATPRAEPSDAPETGSAARGVVTSPAPPR